MKVISDIYAKIKEIVKLKFGHSDYLPAVHLQVITPCKGTATVTKINTDMGGKGEDFAGVVIQAAFSSCGPSPSELNWKQITTTNNIHPNDKIHKANQPFNDQTPEARETNSKYAYTEDQKYYKLYEFNSAHLTNYSAYFFDDPHRDYSYSTTWNATLSLVNTQTQQVYITLAYGFVAKTNQFYDNTAPTIATNPNNSYFNLIK